MTQEVFQPLDTTVVQVRSVLNFMYALGYKLDETGKSGRFVTEIKQFQANRYIGFDSAAKMHNLDISEWNFYELVGAVFPSNVNLGSGFSVIGLKLAFASKLVKQVKLSINRHGKIVLLDPMIVPLNQEVRDLIGL